MKELIEKYQKRIDGLHEALNEVSATETDIGRIVEKMDFYKDVIRDLESCPQSKGKTREEAKGILYRRLKVEGHEELLFQDSNPKENGAIIQIIVEAMEEYAQSSANKGGIQTISIEQVFPDLHPSYWIAELKGVPGLVVQGDTYQEALEELLVSIRFKYQTPPQI